MCTRCVAYTIMDLSFSSADAPDRKRTACYDIEVDVVRHHNVILIHSLYYVVRASFRGAKGGPVIFSPIFSPPSHLFLSEVLVVICNQGAYTTPFPLVSGQFTEISAALISDVLLQPTRCHCSGQQGTLINTRSHIAYTNYSLF